MSYLPKYKIGSCECGASNVQGRKVGKTFYCMNCYNKNKTHEQIGKAIKRDEQRTAITNAAAKLGRVDANTDTNREMSKGYAELERWFKERQKEMTGRCMNCGGKTEAHTKMYKCSIAHILPKAYFKSVATHPDNFLELCFYGNSCHTNMDNKMIDLIDLNCFDTVIQKFTKIYPAISADEKRRIPAILIEYLKTEL